MYRQLCSLFKNFFPRAITYDITPVTPFNHYFIIHYLQKFSRAKPYIERPPYVKVIRPPSIYGGGVDSGGGWYYNGGTVYFELFSINI